MKVSNILFSLVVGFAALSSQAKSFKSCLADQYGLNTRKSAMESVRDSRGTDLLKLMKNGQEVGYIQYDKVSKRFFNMWICSDFSSDYFYVQDNAEVIKNWVSMPGQKVTFARAVFQDEAMAKLHVTTTQKTATSFIVNVEMIAGSLANQGENFHDNAQLTIPFYLL
jgi:hypothetical protein